MSVGFKSMHTENGHQMLIVNGNRGRGGVYLSVDHRSNGVKGIEVDVPTIPELMLALADAIEVNRVNPASRQVRFGTPEHLEHIAFEIARYLDYRDSAKEQVELEAEALELFNTYDNVPQKMSEPPLESFEGMPRHVRDRWLAVARRARELGGRDE